MTLSFPPLKHQLPANAFDVLLRQPSRSTQPCPRPQLVPAPQVPRLFCVLPLSLLSL